MSTSGSEDPGFDSRRDRKFLYLSFRGGEVQLLITRLYIIGLDKIPNPYSVHMRMRIVLLIRPSEGAVSLVVSLVRIDRSRLRASTGFHLHIHLTTHPRNNYTYDRPSLNCFNTKYCYPSPTQRGLLKKCLNRK